MRNAAWTDRERIAYLVLLLEHGGKIDAKIGDAPVPHGRSTTSCKAMLWRLKSTYRDEINNIMTGNPIAGAGGTGDVSTTPRTPRISKRKKVDD
ncbi:hypothetical protein BDV95DRAFT_602693 [Massariosphaeria phaeospora]|uniref:Myb-like domain-containing protein n=1 Tax=Massariosphaeria phaeospora TaxID=100035 RepID=A0A7C8MJ33_9PLEO|nr:hypothetical protein BDV95DRAFT_602693 [Massariosphaeria phaeospora]